MDDFNLDDARARFPLPEGIADEVMNREMLGEAMGVSENTLTKWLARGMPCLEQGGNGREYRFQLSDCYAWRMAWEDDKRQARERARAAAAQLALHFRNDAEDAEGGAPVLTAKEIAEQSIADIKRSQAAELRGELVKTERVRRVFEGALERVRRNLITVPDFCEREFSLTPDQVQRLERRAFSVLEALRQDLDDMLNGGAVVRIEPNDGEAETEQAGGLGI